MPQRARALFEQALEIDPDSATALSGLALSHITEVLNRSSKTPHNQIALAAQAIERSLALQPNDPRANYVRSLVLSTQGRHRRSGTGDRSARCHSIRTIRGRCSGWDF